MTACFEYFDERFDEVAFGNTNLKRRCGGIDRDWRKRGQTALDAPSALSA